MFAGGDVTISRKNENSVNISLDCPIYITTNLLPQFQHAASVMTRLAVYQTTSLPKWLRKHGVNVHICTSVLHLETPSPTGVAAKHG